MVLGGRPPGRVGRRRISARSSSARGSAAGARRRAGVSLRRPPRRCQVRASTFRPGSPRRALRGMRPRRRAGPPGGGEVTGGRRRRPRSGAARSEAPCPGVAPKAHAGVERQDRAAHRRRWSTSRRPGGPRSSPGHPPAPRPSGHQAERDAGGSAPERTFGASSGLRPEPHARPSTASGRRRRHRGAAPGVRRQELPAVATAGRWPADRRRRRVRRRRRPVDRLASVADERRACVAGRGPSGSPRSAASLSSPSRRGRSSPRRAGRPGRLQARCARCRRAPWRRHAGARPQPRQWYVLAACTTRAGDRSRRPAGRARGRPTSIRASPTRRPLGAGGGLVRRRRGIWTTCASIAPARGAGRGPHRGRRWRARRSRRADDGQGQRPPAGRAYHCASGTCSATCTTAPAIRRGGGLVRAIAARPRFVDVPAGSRLGAVPRVPGADRTFRPASWLSCGAPTGQVLAFERVDARGQWQLPQGGIEPGECRSRPRGGASSRETGLGPSTSSSSAGARSGCAYEWPPDVVGARGAVSARCSVGSFFVVDDERSMPPDGGSSRRGDGSSPVADRPGRAVPPPGVPAKVLGA